MTEQIKPIKFIKAASSVKLIPEEGKIMNKSFLFFVGLFLMVQGVLIYVEDTLGFPSFVVGSFVNLWGTIICIEINKKQN